MGGGEVAGQLLVAHRASSPLLEPLNSRRGAPPLRASSRGAQARRGLVPRRYRPRRRRPRRRSTSIARSDVRGANSPGSFSTRKQASAMRAAHIPASHEGGGRAGYRPSRPMERSLSRASAGQEAASEAEECAPRQGRDAWNAVMRAGMRPRGAAVGGRQFGCYDHLHLSSSLQKWRIQAATPGRVSSKP